MDNLTPEGFNLLHEVGYSGVTLDQVRFTFHGIRYDEVHATPIAPHMHEFFELHYLTQGGLYTTIHGVERRYSAGQLYIIPPNSIHSHRCLPAPANHYVGFAIRFSISHVDVQTGNPELAMYIAALENSIPIPVNDTTGTVADEMDRIIESARSPQIKYNIMMRIVALLLTISGMYIGNAAKADAEKPAAMTNNIISNALIFINNHIAYPLTASDVANGISVSYSHLARLFARYMFCSVGDYIMIVKIDHAAHALMNSDMKIADIAVATGFSSASHFTDAFKKVVGILPSEYRQYWKKRYFTSDHTIL